jgi:prepilin-type N-terminal cleavage/methylation domain-containing protein
MTLQCATVFSIFHANKNKGFSLVEVLCALVILTLVIFAAFSALNYTFKITTASRSRMGAFAVAERAAVTSLALEEGILGDPQVDASRTSISGALSIKGVTWPIAMEVFTYKEKDSTKLNRLMQNPAFITFLKKTAP